MWFAPICHECKCGDVGGGFNRVVEAVKLCVAGFGIQCCACCDGCYACIFYSKDICGGGVTGFKDLDKHTFFIGRKIIEGMQLKSGEGEPKQTYATYEP